VPSVQNAISIQARLKCFFLFSFFCSKWGFD
jgi:hypothetical protein